VPRCQARHLIIDTTMFYARADYDNFLRNLKARRFKLSISRNGITDFKEIGLIAVDSVAIDDLRSENVVQGGSVMGYEFRMVFTVPNMSVFADNQYVTDREDISKGRWYVSLLDIETNWVRVTPIPVAIDAIESDFNGTQYSFQLRTSDLEWIKHKSATAPVVINPIILPNDNAVPTTHTQSNPMTFAFRLSNPSIAQSIEDNVLYDILIYLDSARMNLVAQALNKTKAQIIDVAMSQLQVIDVVTALPYTFERGRIYYCIARCKYLNTNADTLFAFTTQLTAPTFVSPPTSVEYPTQLSFQVTTQRNTANANNANANQVEFEWRIGVDVQGIVSAVYNNAGQATGIFQIPSGLNSGNTIFVKARSKNSVVIGEWSDEIEISLTLFRPVPNVLSFTASSERVALQASPTETVRLSFIAFYEDLFGGKCSWHIERTDTLVVIGSGVQASPTFSGSADFNIGNNVASHNPISFRLVIKRPDDVEFESSLITVTFVSRPDVSKARVFFNPNENVFSNDDATEYAVAGGAVAVWRTTNPNPVYLPRTLKQPNSGNRPIYRIVPATQTLPTKRYYIDSFSFKSLHGIDNESYLPALNAPERNKITMMVFGFTNSGNGELVIAVNNSPFYRLTFAAGSGNLWEFTNANDLSRLIITYNANNAFTLFVMTFTRNTANGTKLFRGDITNPTTPVAMVDSHASDFANGVSQPHLNTVANTLSGGIRRVGHIIIFEDTDISENTAELQRWYDWFKAIYKV